MTTGLDVKTPDWVKDAQKKETKARAGMVPGEVKEEAGSKKLKDVKGYEMKEKKDVEGDETSAMIELTPTGASLPGSDRLFCCGD